LSTEHNTLAFSIVKFQQRPKVKEVEIIEIDYKLLHENKRHKKNLNLI